MVDIERLEGVAVAKLSGEIDISRSALLRHELMSAVDNHDFGMVVDLRQATYLDSAGVNVLFELAERLGDRQLRLAAVVPDHALVQQVVTLVNLEAVASLHARVEDAVAAVSDPAQRPPAPPRA